MSARYIASASVYTGSWINWTDGLVKGSTLTVSPRDAGFLIAFLAWFVGVASSASWNLLSSVIFLYRATESPRDALFHQQQMSLRVGVSGVGTLWGFWKLARHWHHRARSPWSRSWLIIFTASVWTMSFSAAGILVSKVTQTRSDVILKPSICGLWDDPFAGGTTPDPVAVDDFESQVEQILGLAGNYVSSCYTFNKSQDAQKSCLAYGRSPLVWNVTDNVQCPFAPEMCSQGKSILLDSGLIDSHSQLGINSRVRDRIQYRAQVHCSPLETEGYVFRTSNVSDSRIQISEFAGADSPDSDMPLPAPSGTQYVGFQYGTSRIATFSNASDASGNNVTYVYNNYTFGLPGTNVASSAYLFDAEIVYLNSLDTTFVPIPQLEQTDADLNIIFLINQASYEGPVKDLWFQALTPVTGYGYGFTTGSYNSTNYVSALPASPMGCIERYQWCKNEGKVCTDLTGQANGGFSTAKKAIPRELRLNSRQQATFNRIYRYVWNTRLYDIADQVTPDILLADEQAATYSVPALPENQGMLEVDHWFGIALTAVQLQTVNYVLGDGRPSHDKYLTPVEGDSEWMCQNQIVQRDDFTSFSILGIVLILLFGGLFFILDICLEPLIVFWYHKIQPSKAWKLRAWRGHGFLQIQSQAFEAKGLATWERTRGDIPVTKHHQIFVSPFSVTLPEDMETKSQTNEGRWWQWKRRIQQQTTDGIDAQSMKEVPLNSRDLLPPIKKSTLQPFEVELGKLPVPPRPGYNRLYTDDSELTR